MRYRSWRHCGCPGAICPVILGKPISAVYRETNLECWRRAEERRFQTKSCRTKGSGREPRRLRAFSAVLSALVKTLTVDNGKKFAAHKCWGRS